MHARSSPGSLWDHPPNPTPVPLSWSAAQGVENTVTKNTLHINNTATDTWVHKDTHKHTEMHTQAKCL